MIVKIQHHIDFADEFIRTVKIGLVDGEHIADLQDARLNGLNIVAHTGDQNDHGSVRRPHNVHLGLPDTDGLDKDDIFAERIHDLYRVSSLVRKPAKAAARSHTADKYALVERQVVHTDAVAQDGAAGKGACGVDGDDADSFPAFAVFLGNLIRHGAFPSTGGSRNAEDIGVSRVWIKSLHDVRRALALVLNRRNGA